MHSDQLNELFTALNKAQAEFQAAAKDSENPYFKSKYSDLASVWEAAKGPLAKYGLCITQTSRVTEQGNALVTTLGHSSGQFIQGEYLLTPVKSDPQAMGSALTYARRYALAAILGIVSSDDDAESAMDRNGHSKTTSQSVSTKPGMATQPQLGKLWASAKEKGWSEETLKAALKRDYGVDSLKDLTSKQASELIDKIISATLQKTI